MHFYCTTGLEIPCMDAVMQLHRWLKPLGNTDLKIRHCITSSARIPQRAGANARIKAQGTCRACKGASAKPGLEEVRLAGVADQGKPVGYLGKLGTARLTFRASALPRRAGAAFFSTCVGSE